MVLSDQRASLTEMHYRYDSRARRSTQRQKTPFTPAARAIAHQNIPRLFATTISRARYFPKSRSERNPE